MKYKLVDADQLDSDLTSIADKVREKAEMSGKLEFPTGIIDAVDQCSSLNFSIIGGTTEPTNPKENTIWVNTETEITGWSFKTDEPKDPDDGMVWVKVGFSGAIEFNALKKNAIHVYPLSVSQYIVGEWMDKTAKSYQNGAFVDWWNGQLYTPGNQWESVTGGWVKGGSDSITLSHGTDGMTLSITGVSDRKAHVTTANAVDLTEYNTLRFKVDVISGSQFVYGVSDTKSLSSYYPSFVSKGEITTTGSKEVTLDISSISGKKYVAFGADGTEAKVTEVKLER